MRRGAPLTSAVRVVEGVHAYNALELKRPDPSQDRKKGKEKGRIPRKQVEGLGNILH